MSPAKLRRKTIVDPRIKTSKQMTGTAYDYVSAPAVLTYGTFQLMDMLNNRSILNLITAYNRTASTTKVPVKPFHKDWDTAQKTIRKGQRAA